MKTARSLLLLVFLLGNLTCAEDDCSAGTEGCACNFGKCDGKLECYSNICVDPSNNSSTDIDNDIDSEADEKSCKTGYCATGFNHPQYNCCPLDVPCVVESGISYGCAARDTNLPIVSCCDYATDCIATGQPGTDDQCCSGESANGICRCFEGNRGDCPTNDACCNNEENWTCKHVNYYDGYICCRPAGTPITDDWDLEQEVPEIGVNGCCSGTAVNNICVD